MVGLGKRGGKTGQVDFRVILHGAGYGAIIHRRVSEISETFVASDKSYTAMETS